MSIKRRFKILSSTMLRSLIRTTTPLSEGLRRLYAHASLAAALETHLPASVVVLGKISVYGSGHISLGEDVLLYPGLHLETQGEARIDVGDDVVISQGTHIVAMAGVTIGKGSMIGEYSSIRDANHSRDADRTLREAGYRARPISIGSEVWLGRGVTVLGGVTIGDRVTVGANAVVTRDIAEGTTVVGIPAEPISRRGRSQDQNDGA